MSEGVAAYFRFRNAVSRLVPTLTPDSEGDATWTGDRPPIRISYVIGTYPLLTTTFIDREIRTLRAQGVTVDVVSLRKPSGDISPEQATVADGTTYARPVRAIELVRQHGYFLLRRPRRYFQVLRGLVMEQGQSWCQRARTIGHFGLAVTVAGRLRADGVPDRIHAHFVDRAATVALVASRLLGVPYSVTAHASDIYIAPVLLDLKVSESDFVTTCTAYNRDHLRQHIRGASDKVVLAYHGIDIDRYVPASDQGRVPTMLAVGQLKEKKGFDFLLEAGRELAARGESFRCEIIGEGPLRGELESKIEELGLADHVSLLGALDHDDVIEAYCRASLFVLPCVIGRDGDRDGIPNVILEAMAMGLPVVSTAISGIPEAVEHGVTGLLVDSANSAALAEALAKLLANPDEAVAMGARGREVVSARFDSERNVRMLFDLFTGVG